MRGRWALLSKFFELLLALFIYVYIIYREREGKSWKVSENLGKLLASLLGLYETNVGTITSMFFD